MGEGTWRCGVAYCCWVHVSGGLHVGGVRDYALKEGGTPCALACLSRTVCTVQTGAWPPRCTCCCISFTRNKCLYLHVPALASQGRIDSRYCLRGHLERAGDTTPTCRQVTFRRPDGNFSTDSDRHLCHSHLWLIFYFERTSAVLFFFGWERCLREPDFEYPFTNHHTPTEGRTKSPLPPTNQHGQLGGQCVPVKSIYPTHPHI